MNDKSINNLDLIQGNIKKLVAHNSKIPEIICVSKTFPLDKLHPLINRGHIHFGENKVQEALIKWNDLKEKNNKI